MFKTAVINCGVNLEGKDMHVNQVKPKNYQYNTKRRMVGVFEHLSSTYIECFLLKKYGKKYVECSFLG